MLTVVLLTWEYPPYLVGGLSRHVHALARELAAEGHSVHVLTRAAPGLAEEVQEDGVHVIRAVPYFQEPPDFRLWVNHLNFGILEKGVRLLQAMRGPVVLHAHDWLVAYAARGLKHLFHLPLVTTIHATEHGRHSGIHDSGQQYINDVEWWLTYEAWRVIVCSEAMRREVQRLFGLGADKLSVIPNGIDLRTPSALGPMPPREAFVAPGERLLFHIGRLVPEKGAGVLLEAAGILKDRYPLRVVIGGVGPYRGDLERQAARLGLAGKVHFTGWVPDEVAQVLYRYADVAVVPSTYEPFGIVALEAMAAGAPLVASDVGGLSEIVEHGVNGLKAEAGNAWSLAQQIDRLLSDSQMAQRLAEGGMQRVQQRYSWRSVTRATAQVYRDVREAWAVSDWGMPRQMMPPVPIHEAPGRYTTQ